MKNKFKIVLYTHSDYIDVAKVFFGETQKYFGDINKVIFINRDHEDIPNEYIKIFYDENLSYKNRILQCIDKLDDGVILLTHEDMFLYSSPNNKILNEFSELINLNKIDFVKLIKVDGHLGKTEIHNNLVMSPKNNMFSIQPTMCSVGKLKILFNHLNSNTIYDIEYEVSNTCLELGLDKSFMCSCDDEKKRGSGHYDSYIYPYVATAIIKGRWNYLEYSKELDEILVRYNIDKHQRGLHTVY